jgi:lipopolysaccharide/colanic/teichoic acid biosynthesis glycosyltransferase
VYRVEPLVASAAILLLMPLGILIAIAIYALSRRGPLVRHARTGWHGAPMGVLKFRTMWNGTESPSRFFSVEDIAGNAPEVCKREGDSRVTSKFAAFCRRHSLDELPQLYHVAKGEMSFVGPRPLTAPELQRWYGISAAAILTLRPGLTGLWQVMGRSRLTYLQRKRLDQFLVRHACPGLYFRIFVKTIPKVLFGDDAY